MCIFSKATWIIQLCSFDYEPRAKWENGKSGLSADPPRLPPGCPSLWRPALELCRLWVLLGSWAANWSPPLSDRLVTWNLQGNTRDHELLVPGPRFRIFLALYLGTRGNSQTEIFTNSQESVRLRVKYHTLHSWEVPSGLWVELGAGEDHKLIWSIAWACLIFPEDLGVGLGRWAIFKEILDFRV